MVVQMKSRGQSFLVLVTTLGWFIWKEGNNFIFNHSPVNPTPVIIKAAMSRREITLGYRKILSCCPCFPEDFSYLLKATSIFQAEALAIRCACVLAKAVNLPKH
ncbi:hypothetical protein RHGRI_025462 [Rhododendron griersonianum]|uniref:Uncharacterized protein n=1 Tax=Rhododendron griersonianum TaxID=479676 RepID=A0AAV6ISU2_9ERIC|nr:hypothetical protein RHGRI_025462 [Rhododendron griersonianum]